MWAQYKSELLKSKKEFEILINDYPSTEFAIDAQFKLGLIKDRLAGKEMYIGRHYQKSKKWIPAINRFKNIARLKRISSSAIHLLWVPIYVCNIPPFIKIATITM